MLNGGRLANQYQEGSLKRILGIMMFAQNTTAHPPNHQSMPMHERRQGGIIVLTDEQLQ